MKLYKIILILLLSSCASIEYMTTEAYYRGCETDTECEQAEARVYEILYSKHHD
jgi:hypothetical protein